MLKIIGMVILLIAFIIFHGQFRKWIISFRRARRIRAIQRMERAYKKDFWQEQERITKGWEEQARHQHITYKGAPEFAPAWEV